MDDAFLVRRADAARDLLLFDRLARRKRVMQPLAKRDAFAAPRR